MALKIVYPVKYRIHAKEYVKCLRMSYSKIITWTPTYPSPRWRNEILLLISPLSLLEYISLSPPPLRGKHYPELGINHFISYLYIFTNYAWILIQYTTSMNSSFFAFNINGILTISILTSYTEWYTFRFIYVDVFGYVSLVFSALSDSIVWIYFSLFILL